jgi:hypothetical protein
MNTTQTIKTIGFALVLVIATSFVQGAVDTGGAGSAISPVTTNCNLSFAAGSRTVSWLSANTSGCAPVNVGADTQAKIGAFGTRALIVGGSRVSAFSGTAVGVNKLVGASESDNNGVSSRFLPVAHAQSSSLITAGYALDINGTIGFESMKTGTSAFSTDLCADHDGYIVSC